MTKLESLRVQRMLSRAAVCQQLYITKSVLKSWETDDRLRSCPIEQVIRLAAIYGVHPSYFFADVPKYFSRLKYDWYALYRLCTFLRPYYLRLIHRVKTIF